MLAGSGLLFAGIGFKLALVPFHMWTPDVYQGAPLPVTTFIATVSKAAILALALRLFIDIHGFDNKILMLVITAVSILSMFTGNLLALRQTSLKRLLAYSSIAHMGYLLITLAAGTPEAEKAAVFYLAAYLITSIAAFGVISVMSVCERDTERIDDLNGLFWTRPLMASALTLAMLSLAGLPLTAGFISKFYLVLAGVKSGLWLLAFSLIVNTVISLYYYLRVIKAMFSNPEAREKHSLSFNAALLMITVISGILFLGIFPSYLTELIGSLIK
jgi:NADH-quinone oxidoreductase subunit N